MHRFRLISKLLRSDAVFYTIFIIFLLLISIYPLYNKIRITPPGYIYTLAQFKIRDFYIYSAVMRQGHQAWLMEDTTAITDEVIPANLVNWFYILLGKLGFVLGIADGWMYYLGMYGSSLLLLVSVIALLYLILPRYLRRIAFMLIFLGGVIPYFTNGWQLADVWPWTLQWESAYHRLTHVPSHLFVEVLVVTSIVLLILFMRKPRFKLIFIAGILSLFGAIFFAPLVVPLLFAIVLTTIFYYGARLNFAALRADSSRLAGISVLVLLTILGLFIINQSIKSGNPGYQNQLAAKPYLQAPGTIDYFEEATVKVKEYWRLFWLFAPFIIFSLPLVIKQWKWERLFIFIYWLTPFYLMYISPLFGIQSWRMANSMPFVTGGILVVWGIEVAARQISNFKFKISKKYKSLAKKIFMWGFAFLLLALAFPQNYFYYQREVKPLFTTQVYIPQAGLEALKLLGQVAPKRAVVLSLEYVADLIPMYTQARGYGTKDYDIRWYQRGGALDPEIEAFYKGAMSEDQAREFLKRNHISYVFYGWDELPLGKGKVHYEKLFNPLFAKDGVYLYEVIKYEVIKKDENLKS